jgi:hypothetical protein
MRLQQTLEFSIIDHGDSDPILHATAGVQILKLRQDQATGAVRYFVYLHKRSITDQAENILMVLQIQQSNTINVQAYILSLNRVA